MKRLLSFALRLGISAALLAWLWHRMGGDLNRLSGIDPLRLWPAILVFGLSTILGAWQWSLLLWHGGVRIGFGWALRLYWIGLFCSNFLPSNVGGDLVKVADVAVSEGSLARPVAATLLDRLLGLLALVLMAFLGGILLGGRTPAGVPWHYLALAGLPIVGALALLLSRRFSALAVVLTRRLTRGRRGQRLADLAVEFSAYRVDPRFLLRMLGLAVVVQTLRVGTHVAVAAELGLGFGLQRSLEFSVLIPVLALAIVLPISLNGLGLREWVATRLMPQVGIAGEDAFVLQIATYLVQVLVSLAGGVLLLVEWGRGRLLRRSPG